MQAKKPYQQLEFELKEIQFDMRELEIKRRKMVDEMENHPDRPAGEIMWPKEGKTPPLPTYRVRHSGTLDHYEVEIVQIDDGLYDLFDLDNGECLNEGTPFPFIPTEAEVKEWIETNKVKGKIE